MPDVVEGDNGKGLVKKQVCQFMSFGRQIIIYVKRHYSIMIG